MAETPSHPGSRVMSAGSIADVVIVGSGPAGSSFARVLHDELPDAQIVIVEAGPAVSEPLGRHVKTLGNAEAIAAAQRASQGLASQGLETPPSSFGTGVPVARPGTFLLDPAGDMPAAAASSNVGGMGAHWTCACPVPGDGERIEELGRAEFDGLFAEASTLLSVSQTAFDDAPLGRELREVLGAALDDGRAPDRRVQPMPLGVGTTPKGERYWTGTDVILADVLQSDRVSLLPETLATRVLVEDGRVTGIETRSLSTGETRILSARAVVVAADALRTPQLLHASGIRSAALGHYLNDHTQVVGLARLADRFLPADRPATAASAGSLAGHSGVSWIPYDRETFPFHGQIMQLDASPIPLPIGEEPWPGSIVGVGLFACKDIRFEDAVAFSDTEVDAYGMPRLQISYGYTDADRDTIAAATAAVDRLCGIIGESVGGNPPILMPPGSSLHYMGTTRMGAVDDGTSVCDTTSRVWGFRNLYVAGNGVIPTSTACNPTATTVALAIKGARSLALQLAEESLDHAS